MKRSTITLLAVVALAVGAAQPASSATKPVTKTYYFHGTNDNGNQDQNPVNGDLMKMDATKPAGTSDKNFLLIGAAVTPNTKCAGSAVFPNWVGKAAGNITGTMTVSFYARSTPSGTAVVQVFADVLGQACKADYPTAIGEATVPITAGPTSVLHTVKIPVSGKGKVSGAITVQIKPGSAGAGLVGPQASGIAYDSTTAPSSITFTCLPKAGKTTC